MTKGEAQTAYIALVEKFMSNFVEMEQLEPQAMAEPEKFDAAKLEETFKKA